MKLSTVKGFTAIETVITVAILAMVGLTMTEVFTRANRMAENARLSEQATALGTMVLEQYSAYAARAEKPLSDYDLTDATPGDFFGVADHFGYENLRLTTRSHESDEDSLSRVSVRVSWGGGLFPPHLTFTRVYPQAMRSPSSEAGPDAL